MASLIQRAKSGGVRIEVDDANPLDDGEVSVRIVFNVGILAAADLDKFAGAFRVFGVKVAAAIRKAFRKAAKKSTP